MEFEGAQLVFVPRAGAEPQWVAFAEAFWSIDNVDDDGRISWSHSVTALPEVLRVDGRDFVLAALGGALEVRGVACPACGVEPYRPTGRTNVVPRTDSRCHSCSTVLHEAMARALSPKQRARAERAAAASAEAAQRRDAKRVDDEARRRAIGDVFALDDEAAPALTLRQAVCVLTVTPSAVDGVVGPFEALGLAPSTPTLGGAMPVAELFRERVLRIDPESEPSAFVWTDGSPDHLASWAAPRFVFAGSGSARDRLATVSTAARERLELARAEETDEVESLLLEAAAGEAARFLDRELSGLQMGLLSEANVVTVVDHVRARGGLPIGRLWRVAWSAARSGLASSKRYRMTRVAATTAAVNAFVRGVDRALSEGLYEDPFVEYEHFPLTPWTSTAFRLLGEASPMTDSPSEVASSLRARTVVAACEEPTGWRDRILEFDASGVAPDADRARAVLVSIARDEVEWACGGQCVRHQWLDWVAARVLEVDDVLVEGSADDRARVRAMLRALSVGRLSADAASAIDMVLEAVVAVD